jgi:hypothetical protein
MFVSQRGYGGQILVCMLFGVLFKVLILTILQHPCTLFVPVEYWFLFSAQCFCSFTFPDVGFNISIYKKYGGCNLYHPSLPL